jgi:hypothetical protein
MLAASRRVWPVRQATTQQVRAIVAVRFEFPISRPKQNQALKLFIPNLYRSSPAPIGNSYLALVESC